MNKKLLVSLLAIISCLVIWFIFNENKPKEDDKKILENVTMIIKEGTLTKKSATVIITDLSEHIITFGNSFRIEKRLNDKWEPLKTKVKEYVNTMEGYQADENNKLEMDIKWEWLYGELDKG